MLVSHLDLVEFPVNNSFKIYKSPKLEQYYIVGWLYTELAERNNCARELV